MKIDPSSPIPIFQQVADSIRAAVARGAYLPGEQIPSIRSLALQLLINPNTVKRAYDDLEREGLIHARKGVGMVVAERTQPAARSRTEDSVLEAFSQGVARSRAGGIPRDKADSLYRDAWKHQGDVTP